MIRYAAPIILLLYSTLASGCHQQDKLFQTQFFAFGTLIELSLWEVDKATAERAQKTIFEDFSYLHQDWHPWHTGTLARINALLHTGDPIAAPPSVMGLINASISPFESSGGLFNPAIGKLVELWGFHQDDLPTVPPEPSAIRALVAQHPSMNDLAIDGIKLKSANPAIKLDFGAFAKGRAIDLAIRKLRRMGVDNALVNAGGDLGAIGMRGERHWRIGIRHPRQNGIIAWLETVGNESVFTSGDYERFFFYEGRRYHHIIDPRSGYPTDDTILVTVVHPEAAIADAAATALFVAGPELWEQTARDMGITYVLLIDHRGHIHMSPEMAKRISFTVDPQTGIGIPES